MFRIFDMTDGREVQKSSLKQLHVKVFYYQKKKVKTGNPHLAIDSSAATETGASYATTLAAFYSTGFFHMYFLV